MSRLVLFSFAGREANLSIQLPYLERILDDRPDAVVHWWDLTRTPEDAAYIREVAAAREDGRIEVIDHLHPGHPICCRLTAPQPPPRPTVRRKGYQPRRRGPRAPRCVCMVHRPPYEKPYAWYAANGDPDDVYVKLDDDIVFIETRRFHHLIGWLAAYPNAVVSANVINNAVCAKYDPFLGGGKMRVACGDPALAKNDRKWWYTHTMPDFATDSHDWFLSHFDDLTAGTPEPAYIHTRPGEAISINMIAFTHPTMVRLAAMMNDRLGDEGAVDRLLPRIATTFHAAHLTFGPQDARLATSELDDLRASYAQLAKEYLT